MTQSDKSAVKAGSGEQTSRAPEISGAVSSVENRMGELPLRIVTATVLVGLLVFVEFKTAQFPWMLIVFAAVIWGAAFFELLQMVRKIGGVAASVSVALLGVLPIVSSSYVHFREHEPVLPLLCVLAVTALVLVAGRARDASHAAQLVFMGLVGLGVFGFGGSGLLTIVGSSSLNVVWSLWLISLVVITDIGAYVCGRALKGPKLAPSLSPGKTISGAVGACILALILAPSLGNMLGIEGSSLVAWTSVLALVIVAQVGDLLESLAKRLAGVKDSGHLLPGHGGVYDRVDGLLAAAALFPFLV